MDRYQDIKAKILEYANKDEDIKAIVAIGSSTRKEIKADEFSDLDLFVVTNDPEKWYSGEYPELLGNVSISFIEPTLGGGKERRCIYDEDRDVDMIILTPEQFEAADMDNDGLLTPKDASKILQIYAEGQSHDPETPAQNVIIYTNGAQLIVGVPDDVIANGLSIYIDCGLYLIYYYDLTGEMVNIMNYSSLDLPLLHTGENYMWYEGQNVSAVSVIINERWL